MIKGVSMANVRKQLFSIVPNKYNDKNIALHINPEGDTTTIQKIARNDPKRDLATWASGKRQKQNKTN